MTPFPLTELRTLQASIGAANAAKGFHDEGDALRKEVAERPRRAAPAANLRNYYANKLLLVVSEVVEAHDELRKGRAIDETYYPKGGFKPEGFPSEIADSIIRLFDIADEANIDIAYIIREKLLYNEYRPYMHGKKF